MEAQKGCSFRETTYLAADRRSSAAPGSRILQVSGHAGYITGILHSRETTDEENAAEKSVHLMEARLEFEGNGSSTEDELRSPLPVANPYIAAYLIFIVSTAVVSNSLVLLVLSLRRKKLRPFQLCLVSMCVSDLLFSLCLHPMSIATALGYDAHAVFSHAGCMFFGTMALFFGSYDMVAHSLIAVLRYINLCRLSGAVTVYSYIAIIVEAGRQRRVLEKLGRVSTFGNSRLAVELKLVRLTSVIASAYVIAWFPYAVVCLHEAYGDRDSVPKIFRILSALFCKTAAATNPIIYLFMSKGFRREVAETFHVLLKCKRRGASFLHSSSQKSSSCRSPSEISLRSSWLSRVRSGSSRIRRKGANSSEMPHNVTESRV